jgi:hypothetical protein
MKSVEVKFAEAMDALKKAGKAGQFESKLNPIKETAKVAGKTVSIEVQLNLAEAVLKDAGVVRTKESTPIKKNNGAGDNFVEGNPLGVTVEEFRESSNSFSPGYIKETTNPCQKGDKIMADWMLKNGKINESQHRKLTGQKPEGYEKLSEAQKKEFDFARLIGISESDAFKLANIAGTTFREVSRR